MAEDSETPITEARPKDWKVRLGLVLFVLSFVPILALSLLPLFAISIEQAAGLATAGLVTGELLGMVSVALLGKTFVDSLKRRVRRLFRRPADAPPMPISLARHRAGVVMFFLGALAIYPLVLIPFLDLPRETELRFVLATYILGEVLFLSSLVVLGSEFWERFKNLFEWPGVEART